MHRPIRTKPVSSAQVRAYAGKAEEFADASDNEIEVGWYIAATSLAIHAGINAADAVCGARLGERAAGDDHDQVLTLLRRAGPDGAKADPRSRLIATLGSRLLDQYCRCRCPTIALFE
jgi:hypothetical protein